MVPEGEGIGLAGLEEDPGAEATLTGHARSLKCGAFRDLTAISAVRVRHSERVPEVLVLRSLCCPVGGAGGLVLNACRGSVTLRSGWSREIDAHHSAVDS
jgi:hypothetical protein